MLNRPYQVPATPEQPTRSRLVSEQFMDVPRSELIPRPQKLSIQSLVERPVAGYPQLPPLPPPKPASHPRIYARLKTVKSFLKRYTSDSDDDMNEGFDTGRGADLSTDSEPGHGYTRVKIAQSRALDPSPTICSASKCKVPRPPVLTASFDWTRENSTSRSSEKRAELSQEDSPGTHRKESESFPDIHSSRSHTPENSVHPCGYSSDSRARSGSLEERMHTKSHREQGKTSQKFPVVTSGPHPITRHVVPMYPPDVASEPEPACSKPKNPKLQPSESESKCHHGPSMAGESNRSFSATTLSMSVNNPAEASGVGDSCFDDSSCAKEDKRLSWISDLTSESIQINMARLLKPAIACKLVLTKPLGASQEVSSGSGSESSAESSKHSSILSRFTICDCNSSQPSPGSQDDSEDYVTIHQLRHVMRGLTRLLDEMDPQNDLPDPLHKIPFDPNSPHLTHNRRVKLNHTEFFRLIQQELVAGLQRQGP